MPANYTLQDIASLLPAILLFPLASIVPGYVIGWLLDLFSFRKRTPLVQYVFGATISNAVVPLILYLAYRFVSDQFGIGLLFILFVGWVVIQIRTFQNQKLAINKNLYRAGFTVAAVWITFCIFLLVDFQIGQRLYFNTASYDHTTRVALIEAVTRTGIPPVNPAYYPGHFERITELYYFWYIAPSVIDAIGGAWIDARIALFAGIAWTGLALMATIATYLRLRNNQNKTGNKQLSLLGIKLLAVGGLDFIPVLILMLAVKAATGTLPFDGRMEGWNLPVMSWLNAITWVPNHVASMAACIVALLAMHSIQQETGFQKRIVYVVLAGASIGSAFGMSVWVAATFGLFMGIWGIVLLFRRTERGLVVWIMASGILGLLFVSQFIFEILQGGGKSAATGGMPVGLYVRPFLFTRLLPHGIREVIEIFLLPVNYLFELGFFFAIAVLWIKQRSKTWKSNSFMTAEFTLLVMVAVLLSFVKSTVIVINDLGMRAWLLGQFVLIIWAVDILSANTTADSLLPFASTRPITASKRSNDLMRFLLIVGFLTTAMEATATRFWPILVDTGITGVPNELTPDTNLGKRTYAARLAYEYVRDHTPPDLIVQNNPLIVLDRPSGLYGTRQMVIGDRTSYGVPLEEFKRLSTEIGTVFNVENVTEWSMIDKTCDKYFIEAIIVKDTDLLWSSLDTLARDRPPLYQNPYYAVFECGN